MDDRLLDRLEISFDHLLRDPVAGRGHTLSELHLDPTNLWDRLRSSTRSIRCADNGVSF